MMKIRTLWIGWGPGGNSKFEKSWFHAVPNLHVWEQPHLNSGETNVWLRFVQDGIQFIRDQIATSELQNETVHLIVHSFGLQIFFAWLKSHPERLPFQVSVLAANFSPFSAYENLGRAHQFVEFDAKDPRPESFSRLLGVLMSDPKLLEGYWAEPDSEAHQRYQALQAKVPHLRFETFLAVMNELVERGTADYPEARTFEKDLPFTLQVYLGDKDPLLCVPEEIACWKQSFPRAHIEVLPCGHFPHFEVPTLQIFKVRSP